MPKPKGKGKSSGKAAPNKNRRMDPQVVNGQSDEDTFSDTTSYASLQFDGKNQDGGEEEADPEVAAQEAFQDKLQECIDEATQKSAQGRLNCLKGISMALCRRLISDFLDERRFTIADLLEKSLKKGKGEEQSLAAHITAQVCVQLGSDATEIYTTIKPILVALLSDQTASVTARASCASSLGLCAFIIDNDMLEISSVMTNLEHVFSASYLKGNGDVPTHTPETTALHAAALSAWSLLLCILPYNSADVLITKLLPKLTELLYSNDVDLRIASGEVIALCYELMRTEDESFEGDDIDVLCELLKNLATDSSKNRAKKERKYQRSSFRDILKCVEEGQCAEIRIKFGAECLFIDSWMKKREYDSFCHVVASGMNLHLKENMLLRQVFELGSVLSDNAIRERKSNKEERRIINSEAFRLRTKIRSKARDKRMVMVH